MDKIICDFMDCCYDGHDYGFTTLHCFLPALAGRYMLSFRLPYLSDVQANSTVVFGTTFLTFCCVGIV